MALPVVVALGEGTPAAEAGVAVGDEIVTVNGQVPRDVIAYQVLVDGDEVELELRRGGLELTALVHKQPGERLGIEVASAIFDRVRTCDNHCEFCFIYQLPKGMRRSLYLKDDDYRLSFLYGNFTTLTRFTEADLERVLDEHLSPLFVSIHATDPEVRARLLRNRRGASSLRWLRALLDNGIEVHGQIVVCPGVNDGPVLEDTMVGILDEYPELASAAAVPVGVSRWSAEQAMRPHTPGEALAVVETVERWQVTFQRLLGRRLVFAADEYYLLAGLPFPQEEDYEGFPQHENGVGIARSFVAAFGGDESRAWSKREGFFAWVDGAPAAGYRAPRAPAADPGPDKTTSTGPYKPPAPGPDKTRAPAPRRARVARRPAVSGVGVLTGEYGASVLGPLLQGWERVRVIPVQNTFFGGNIAVTGLLVGADLMRVLEDQPVGDRYLLPDVCLSEGRFLDGLRPEDLPRPVEIVPSDGLSLRRALEAHR